MKQQTKLSVVSSNLVVGSLLVIASTAAWLAIGQVPAPRRGFTQADVRQVEQAMKGVDPARYRIVLPVFTNGRVVGSKTYGTLTMAQVKLVAAKRRVVINERGNMQLVMEPGNASAHASGANTTNTPPPPPDPPQATNESDEAGAHPNPKLAQVLDRLAQNIEKGQFVYLKATSAGSKGQLGVQKP